MGLPVNIGQLINGEAVEWDRLEFKEGWNPEEVVHSICAFANDINNWGGGYIIIGIKEKNGVPELPPAGIASNSLDKIQKDLLNLSHQIEPFYSAVSQPYKIQGKNILCIWIPGGDNRPYKAPTTLGAKGQKRYYVRRGSNTVLANQQEERLLHELAKRVPFDDRVNHHASISDVRINLITDFLHEVKSDLAKEVPDLKLSDVLLQMKLAAGPSEAILPLNVALLFFSEAPSRFFRGAVTEVIIFEDLSGKKFTEKTFDGPIHHQMKNVLSFLQNNIIKQKVIKSSGKAEADRPFNFPFDALEEIIANAYYHRSYELDNPIEINVWPDKIEVLSFPGPLPPVTKAMLKQRRIVARNYRNRRVGDFLKELKLTEGRATGLPTIYDSMLQNGSPKPIFETDDDFNYFLAVLPIHDAFSQKKYEATEQELKILLFALTPRKRSDILKKIGLTNHPKNYQRYILPLIDKGWLKYSIPESPTSPKQQYFTTAKGKKVLG